MHDNEFSPVMNVGAPKARRCGNCSAAYSKRFRRCPKCGKSALNLLTIAYAVGSAAFLAVAVAYTFAR